MIRKYFVIISVMHFCNGGTPPRVEGKPNLLDSFIPASMQIMAHLTELMKYDLKPQNDQSTTTSTTTMRPTPSHKPGIYAPEYPPGPEAYFKRGDSYEEYIQRIQNPNIYSFFDRYISPIEIDDSNRNSRSGFADKTVEMYFGKSFTDTLSLVNRIENDFIPKDVDNQVQEFSQNYDDSDFRFVLLRQKKIPPTRAYVTLLSLYDLLNKESKRLGLNKYQGFTDNIITQLAESSTGTSAYQLRYVLKKIVERQDTKREDILKKINQLIADLDQDNSYINDALRYIPPLPYEL